MGKPKRILVFGSSNVGKTSMCNELTGETHSVSNNASGTTSEISEYKMCSFGDSEYVFLDTVGLHEAATGTVSAESSMDMLLSLIRHGKGFNLLIQVIKAGTIQLKDSQTYELVAQKLTENRIPVVIVVTHCEYEGEDEEDMQQWVKHNKSYFERANMHSKQMIATCFKKGGKVTESYLSELRRESSALLWEAIATHSTETPVDLVAGGDSDVKDKLRRLWNAVCEFFKVHSLAVVEQTAYRASIKRALHDAAELGNEVSFSSDSDENEEEQTEDGSWQTVHFHTQTTNPGNASSNSHSGLVDANMVPPLVDEHESSTQRQPQPNTLKMHF
eukprot:TRINITY_DN115659_c0_g1_i1.p1 TRINITY_DN115659_c0_g1~~TRINITY_DN115659_c0_g1_i1.p1  ORF type:complete len:331 (-),score=37.57 TRINITY_DN115659_c0_g1_i1:113-1105(-)